MTKFIRISIADKNDNPPYFDKHLYEAEVDENEDIQVSVSQFSSSSLSQQHFVNFRPCHENRSIVGQILSIHFSKSGGQKQKNFQVGGKQPY